MESDSSYPAIEPSNFDLIVIGTGLPEAILAAAASAAGKTVLHLDPNPFSGSHYTSLPLNDLIPFLQSHPQSQYPHQPTHFHSDHRHLLLSTRTLYSSLQISSYSPLPLQSSNKFSIDLAGPRVLLCADQIINFILETQVNQYMEFKGIDASYIGDGHGRLELVPDSRSAIFKDKKLSLQEKNRLMRFFKLVKEHIESQGEGKQGEKIISEDDLDISLMEFLSQKMGLSKKLREYTSHLFDYSVCNRYGRL